MSKANQENDNLTSDYYPLLLKKFQKVKEKCDSDDDDDCFDEVMSKVIEYKNKNIQIFNSKQILSK